MDVTITSAKIIDAHETIIDITTPNFVNFLENKVYIKIAQYRATNPDHELNTLNIATPTYSATPAKLPIIAPIVPNKAFPFFIISPSLTFYRSGDHTLRHLFL
mgnify:CR=1 FL=1